MFVVSLAAFPLSSVLLRGFYLEVDKESLAKAKTRTYQLLSQSVGILQPIFRLQEVKNGRNGGQMEEFSVKVEPASNPQQTSADDDLFHDMTPVFQKPKKIVVKKKKVHSDENYHTRTTENPSSRLNFDISYTPAQPELGTWNDESTTVWDEEAVSEKDIEWETEKLMKERKQAERERRAIEQQRRKEERE
ncbi:hypothetical protein OS493_019631, partial [Desmophyllum pertusum]